MTPIITKSFKSAALALGLLGAPLALSGLQLVVPSLAHAESAPTLAQMKQTLLGYGEFVSHAKYGEVWKPTVTPRGWHPYPACDWVFTKDYGWYFNDKTPWGAIVHHYGRWIHEANDGWLWVPGAEFSPGWVVWRTSAEWVGWAPTPPDAELTPAALEEFNDDKLWTFMDAKKFGSTCDGGVTTAQFGDVWRSTTYVTDIRFVGGVGVFVLPPAIVGPFVDIDINIFAPWTVNFIGSWVWNWSTVFNDIDINIINVNTCGPNDPQIPGDKKGPNGQTPNDGFKGKPLIKNISDAPPPPPSGVRQPRNPSFEPTGPSRQPQRVQGPRVVPDRDIVVDRNPGRRPNDRFVDPRRDVEPRNPQRIPNFGRNIRTPNDRVVDQGRSPNRQVDQGRSPNREIRGLGSQGGGAIDRVRGARTFDIQRADRTEPRRGGRSFERLD